MMREGSVFFKNDKAGRVWEDENGYHFAYDTDYMAKSDAMPISLTMPFQEAPYSSRTMLPFFDGLIPEGWLLDLTLQTYKLKERDRMGLLLAVCEDTIGAVTVKSESAS